MSKTYTFSLEDNLVIAREGSQHLFVLNAMGRLMWELFQDGLDADGIVRHIADHYGISQATARSDVDSTFANWRENGLLVPAGNDSAYSGDMPPIPPEVKDHNLILPEEKRWLFSRTYRLWETKFMINMTDQDMAGLIFPLMAHMETSSDEDVSTQIGIRKSKSGYIVELDGLAVRRESTSGDTVACIIETLVRRGMPWFDPVAVLHASAVSDGQGAAVLAAPARSGKSTLTAALVHAGFTYFSDDSVPLDTDLYAIAMPLAICLKEGSWPVLASRYPQLEDSQVYHRFGRNVRYLFPQEWTGNPMPQRVPVRCLLFPRYEKGRKASLAAILPVEALRRLVEADAWLSFEAGKLAALVAWIARTPAFTLEYGSLDEAIPLVRQVMQGIK